MSSSRYEGSQCIFQRVGAFGDSEPTFRHPPQCRLTAPALSCSKADARLLAVRGTLLIVVPASFLDFFLASASPPRRGGHLSGSEKSHATPREQPSRSRYENSLPRLI